MSTKFLKWFIPIMLIAGAVMVVLPFGADEGTGTADPTTGTQIGDLYYTFSGSDATVIGYSSGINWSTFTAIPDTVTYNGVTYTVTSISTNAFYNCTNLALTSLPSGLTSIGNSAFQNCTNLALTSLPSGVTSIGSQAFYGCTSLALTSLSSGLTSIGNSAFQNCTSLALTSLPSGVTSIDTHTFYGCTSLALTSLPNGLTTISDNAFYNCTSLALTSLPSGLTSIGTNTFYGCTNLALTSLPSGVTTIGDNAFAGCINLALTSLPSGVTDIGMQAFISCTSLALTSLPSGLTSINVGAFQFCTNLALTSLPSGVTIIARNAFNGCTSLALTSLPSGVATIGDSAFGYCSGISYMIVPESVSSIGNGAFQECTSLVTVYNASSLNITAGATTYGDIAHYATNVYDTKVVTVTTNNPDYGTVSNDKLYAVSGSTLSTNGNELSSSVPNQTAVATPATDTEQYRYLFDGWMGAGSPITSNTTVTANFVRQSANVTVSFTVNQANWGTVSSAYISVPRGSVISVNGATMTIGTDSVTATPSQNSAQYTYAFVSWSQTSGVITDSMTITATFSRELREYDVTITSSNFAYGDVDRYTVSATYGTVVYTNGDVLTVGTTDITATPTEPSARYSYAFKGWSNAYGTVTADRTIVANFNATYQGDVWTFIINEDNTTATLAKLNKTNLTSVTIPATVSDGTDTYTVVGVGDGESPIVADSQISANGATLNLGPAIIVINDSAFENCSKLKGNLVIPSTVMYIGSRAFQDCDKLTGALTIPDSVVEMGEGVFADCEGFTSLVLGTDLNSTLFTDIPDLAFYNCKNITGMLQVPFSVTDIGEGAFAGTGLTSLWITDYVEYIGPRIIQNCSKMEIVVNYSSAQILPKSSIPDGVPIFTKDVRQGNYTYLANDEIAVLVRYTDGPDVIVVRSSSREVVIPSTITDDGVTSTVVGVGLDITDFDDPANGVFYCQSLTSVQLPDTLESIGKYVFYGCNQLTEILIPEDVTSIGEGAFAGCTNLKTVYNSSVLDIEKGKDTYGGVAKNANAVYNGITISDNLMYECSDGFASVVKVMNIRSNYSIPTMVYSHDIPYVVDRIADNPSSTGHDGVFSNIFELTSISLPVTVIHVGKDAFYNCTNLQSITLSVTLESIGDYAFYNCASIILNSLPTGLVSVGVHAFDNAPVTISALPVTLESIGDYAFRSSEVSFRVIPVSVTHVGTSAFFNCDSITELEFTKPSQVSANVLASADNITTVTLPTGLTQIPMNMCKDCSALRSITIPTAVTVIGASAFQGCTALTSILLPDGLKYIYQDAFKGAGLTSVTLPKGLIEIQNNAMLCPNLATVINNSTTLFVTIGAEDNGKVAFNATHVRNNVPYQFGNYKITTQDLSATICAYMSGNTEYLMIPGQFTSTIDSVTVVYTTLAIGDDVFKGKTLGTVIIPDSVTSIGDNAFKGAKIRLYQLPSEISHIGNGAFQDTSSVIITELPATVRYIGDYAFAGTGSTFNSASMATHIGEGAFAGCKMTTMVLPENTTIIPNALFKGCSLLTFVNLNGVARIGDYAFQNCPLLTGFTTIPQDMSYIGDYAFQNDLGLNVMMVIGADNLKVGTNAFDGCTNLRYITDFSVLGLVAGSTSNGKLAYYASDIQYTMSDVGLIHMIELHDKETKQKTEGWWVMIAVIPTLILVGIIIMAVKSFIGKEDDDDDGYYDNGYPDADDYEVDDDEYDD